MNNLKKIEQLDMLTFAQLTYNPEDRGDIITKEDSVELIIQDAEKRYSGWELAEYLAEMAKKQTEDSKEYNLLLQRAGQEVSDML